MSLGIVLGIAGIVIGVPALFFAIPPFLQMLYGRPDLDISVTEHTDPHGKSLLLHIQNKPTSQRWLKRIGVERDVGNVFVYFDIRDAGTRAFVAKDISATLHCAPTREQGLIARAFPALSIGASIVHSFGDNTWIVDGRKDENENLQEIPVGDYVMEASVLCGEKLHNVRRAFKVGGQQHLTFWV